MENTIQKIKNKIKLHLSGTPEETNNSSDGFNKYLKEAQAKNKDVNDYLEADLNWLPAKTILTKSVFPYINNIEMPYVLEVGPGTGRFSRHLLECIEQKNGQLYLIDNSKWEIDFLKSYFKANERLSINLTNGRTFEFINDHTLNYVFCQGLFFVLDMGTIFSYILEFARTLKKGGYVYIDFFDLSTQEGKSWLKENYTRPRYTYMSHETVQSIFNEQGFKVVTSFISRSKKCMVLQKE